ncbi:MAG TPA: hypothetical protein VLL97_04040, partial [Acidobacteriota bacterium]|nr:hypothetical protein [Acidobacteriota bacterium]
MKIQYGILCVLAAFLVLSATPVPGEAITSYKISRIGRAPNFIVLNSEGTLMYATSFATNELLEIDLRKKAVTRRVVVGSSPLGLALDKQETIVMVACRDSGTVAVVDLGSFQVIADIRIGGRPNSVMIDSRGYRAYVVDYGRT